MKLNLTRVRMYVRGHRSESVLEISSKLHKSAQKPRAGCDACMDSANRQHLEGGLEPMFELKDWTLLSCRNMCRS